MQHKNNKNSNKSVTIMRAYVYKNERSRILTWGAETEEQSRNTQMNLKKHSVTVQFINKSANL